MKVDAYRAERAAREAAAIAETVTTLKALQAIESRVRELNTEARVRELHTEVPLSDYGEGYRRALTDVFAMLYPDMPNPSPKIPPEVWAR